MYPKVWDSGGKLPVIPDNVFGPKFFALGAVCVLLACWWGKSLPRLRWLAGVRAWPVSLGLRHCPDTYGWLQSRIFRNGRKPDGAMPRGG